jgi:2-methylcitrate dehydratase PrpD
VKLEPRAPAPGKNLLGSRVSMRLKDGRRIEEELEHFPGTPDQPLDRAGLREKFDTITAGPRQNQPSALFDAIVSLDRAPNVRLVPWSF